MRKRTFKVLKWENKAQNCIEQMVSLNCENCQQESFCPMDSRVLIEAGNGMGIFFDPLTPTFEGWQPQKIQCRKCGHTYES